MIAQPIKRVGEVTHGMRFVVLHDNSLPSQKRRGCTLKAGEIIMADHAVVRNGMKCIVFHANGAACEISLSSVVPLDMMRDSVRSRRNVQPGDWIRITQAATGSLHPDKDRTLLVGDLLQVVGVEGKCLVYELSNGNTNRVDASRCAKWHGYPPGRKLRVVKQPNYSCFKPNANVEIAIGDIVVMSDFVVTDNEGLHIMYERGNKTDHQIPVSCVGAVGAEHDPITQSIIDKEDQRFLDAVNSSRHGDTMNTTLNTKREELIQTLDGFSKQIADKKAEIAKKNEAAVREKAVGALVLSANDSRAGRQVTVEIETLNVSSEPLDNAIALLKMSNDPTVEMTVPEFTALKNLTTVPVCKQQMVVGWNINNR
jgi:hypothetical protein